MCQWCHDHGDRDHKWYEKAENYIFEKVFPDEAEQERIKDNIKATF